MLRILDRIYLGAASAGSGGGSVDESRIIVKSETIPTAGENYLGSVYMYVGETNSTYTHGYIYECVESGSTYAWERIDVQPGATRGRFLALWNCATGLAESNPPSSPYPYGTGDYYIVGTVGTTNYKPSGSSYVIGTASTTVETDDVAVNDTYYYDGNNWNLQKNTATEYVAGTGISINNKTISVASPTLTNTSTGSGSLTISGTSASEASATNVGVSSSASGSFGSSFGWGSSASGNYSTAVGSQSTAYFYSAAFGYGSTASSQNTTAIGPASTASAYGAIALGHNARATKESAIQIGNGVNSEDKTMYVGALINNTDYNYKLLDLTTGKIPADRLPSTTPSIDNTTITENASNQLQASAVMNARTGTDVLPIWQGTEQQWTNGKSTDWYNWRTDVAMTGNTSMGNIRTGDYPTKVVYGNSVYLAKSEYIGSSGSSSTYYYSTDGINWSSKTLPENTQSIAFGNGLFVAAGVYSTNIYTSENGIDWTTRTVSKYAQGNDVVCNFVNGRFYIASSSGYTGVIYSDDGIDWTYLNESSKGHFYLYGNGMYVATDKGSSTVYTSLDGFNWTSHNIYEKLSSNVISGIVYGNGLFVIVSGLNIFTTTDFETITYRYQNVLQPNTSYPAFGDGKFVIVGQYNNGTRTIGYSDTGIKWNTTTISQTSSNGALARGAYYANGYFFVSGYMSNVNRLTFDQSSVYTLEASPTTASTVYSEPNTTSALTITSIGTGTITLSDNNTYTYTSSGDVTTYQTIGDAYPNYLANIEDVGVKIGNTLIADNTDTSILQTKTNLVTSVSSSSTDSQYPSAKLLYDTVGNIEATLDAIIAQGSNS